MDKDQQSSAKKSNGRIAKQWERFTTSQKDWVSTYEKRAFLILVAFILGLLILWLVPKWQAQSLRASLDACDINEIQPIERIQLAKDLAAAENSARLTIAQIIGGL